jgi:hypothetical protein
MNTIAKTENDCLNDLLRPEGEATVRAAKLSTTRPCRARRHV